MSTAVDPITLEVIQGSLINAVRQMRATLIRTSYAPILYDTRDLSCALLSPVGELVAMSDGDFSGHVFSLQLGLTPILEKFGSDMHPGDVFMFNDPYTGGTHLNDIAFYKPHFVDGRIVLFETVRAHWSDVGGATPGSFSGQDTEIYQEGVRIPPVRLVDKGTLNRDLWDLLFANVRLSDEQEGNAMAMLDAVNVGERRVEEMCEKYGVETLEACRDTLLDRAERTIRERIRALPDDAFYVEHYCDNTGLTDDPVPLRLRMKVDGDELRFDFSGTADEFEGPMNVGPAVTQAGVFVIVKSWLDPDTPVNGGTFRALDFHLPEGSVVNARPPRAVAGVWELYRHIQSAAAAIFSQAMPEIAGGGSMETINHIYISSFDPDNGRHFILYEYPQGGYPGTASSDGTTGCPSYDGGDVPSIYPVESSEQNQPLMIESTEITRDGEGAGRFRSGFGITRRIRVLSDNSQLNVMQDAAVFPPWGVGGADAGGFNACGVVRDGEEISPSSLPGKVRSFPLKRGDLVIMRATAGGGVGDPLEREPALVQADVATGCIGAERASDTYGVVLKDGAVDAEATVARREALKAERVMLTVDAGDADDFDERGVRRVALTPADAELLGVGDDSVVELVPDTGAPLRCWVRVSQAATAGHIQLGPQGLEALRLEPGAALRVRALVGAAPIVSYTNYPDDLVFRTGGQNAVVHRLASGDA